MIKDLYKKPTNPMRVLVACEESQRVCLAFRERGHQAYSCDIQDCSGGHPEWHINRDVCDLLRPDYTYSVEMSAYVDFCYNFQTQDGQHHTLFGKWDLIIAHPPCTYLSNAGARHLYKGKLLNIERYNKGLEGKLLFMKLLNADCERICIENPIPSSVYGLPKYTQIIQPYEYGHPYQKRTCLWLKGLPNLQPTNILPKDQRQSTRVSGNWFNKGGSDRQVNRAKTFEGIAKAMSEQWG